MIFWPQMYKQGLSVKDKNAIAQQCKKKLQDLVSQCTRCPEITDRNHSFAAFVIKRTGSKLWLSCQYCSWYYTNVLNLSFLLQVSVFAYTFMYQISNDVFQNIPFLPIIYYNTYTIPTPHNLTIEIYIIWHVSSLICPYCIY